MLNYTRLCALHESLLGDPPGEEQRTLYHGYPQMRGYSDRGLTQEKFEAVFLLALAQTLPMGSGKVHKAMLFVAAPSEKWAIEQMNRIAQVIFGRLRETANVKAADLLKAAFTHLMTGKHVLQVAEEPDRWAAFGFHSDDPLPEWLRASLLGV